MVDLLNWGHAPAEIVTLEAMSRSDWGRRKKRKIICHSTIYTPFGKMLVASFDKKICFMGMYDAGDFCMSELRSRYPNAEFKKQTTPEHQNLRHFFMKEWKDVQPISLYVHGTAFQIQVWQELLKIPVGKISTYGEIAKNIGRPRSARAVGRAVGKNPIVYVIPCHRVICSSGKMGDFFWGAEQKLKFLNHESRSGHKIQGYSNWEPTLF